MGVGGGGGGQGGTLTFHREIFGDYLGKWGMEKGEEMENVEEKWEKEGWKLDWSTVLVLSVCAPNELSANC